MGVYKKYIFAFLYTHTEETARNRKKTNRTIKLKRCGKDERKETSLGEEVLLYRKCRQTTQSLVSRETVVDIFTPLVLKLFSFAKQKILQCQKRSQIEND
jgi:hypothetical protein